MMPANMMLKNISAAPQAPSLIRAQVIPRIRATITRLTMSSMVRSLVVSGRSGLWRRSGDFDLLDDPEQLVDRGLALDDLPEAVLLEVDHPVLAGLGLDGVDRRVLADQVAHRLGDDQQF